MAGVDADECGGVRVAIIGLKYRVNVFTGLAGVVSLPFEIDDDFFNKVRGASSESAERRLLLDFGVLSGPVVGWISTVVTTSVVARAFSVSFASTSTIPSLVSSTAGHSSLLGEGLVNFNDRRGFMEKWGGKSLWGRVSVWYG